MKALFMNHFRYLKIEAACPSAHAVSAQTRGLNLNCCENCCEFGVASGRNSGVQVAFCGRFKNRE